MNQELVKWLRKCFSQSSLKFNRCQRNSTKETEVHFECVLCSVLLPDTRTECETKYLHPGNAKILTLGSILSCSRNILDDQINSL